MIINTHAAIGEFLYKYITSSTMLELNRRSFIYGNMKPDIDRTLFQMTHRFESIEDFLNNLTEDIYSGNQSLQSFSNDLGILCHFLCDGFCSFHFHEDLWEKNIVEHIAYELKLHYIYKSLDKKKILVDMKEWKCHDDMGSVFRTLKEQFINDKQSMATDISYAIRFSMITTEILNKNMNKVAIPAHTYERVLPAQKVSLTA